MLVVAASVVVGFGAAAGLTGAQGDARGAVLEVDAAPVVGAGAGAVSLPADSKWD
ncbi:hypothetical protein ACGFZL_04120 [Streptomyces sp. NPDC048182]|uniref:hypothetical protein n=1 Tax=Streptomyces sp. NPDC048182 TaxID=3365507 RepID=UPI0037106C67